MNIIFNGVINPATTPRPDRCQPASRDANQEDILILTRNSDVATSIYKTLRVACRGCEIIRAACVESALKHGRDRRFSVAFLGCDLPDTVFRKIQRDAAGKPVRIIGIREGGGTMQALRLMSCRLISAYVSMPVSLASLQALAQGQRRQS